MNRLLNTSIRRRFGIARLTALALGVICAAGMPSARAAAPNGPEPLPLTDRLGEETSSYVYRMGWDTLREKLKGTTALAAIEQPQVQTFFAELRRVAQRPGQAGRAFELGLAAIQDELVMAGTETSPAGEGDTAKAEAREEQEERGGDSSLQVGFVLPPASRRAELGRLADAAAKAWSSSGQPGRAGADAFICLNSEVEAPLFYWDGKMCYWANSRPAAEWALREQASKPLSKSAFFQATLAPLFQGRSDAPIALYYYDLRPNWEAYQQMPAAAGWNLLSWRSLDSLAGATFVEDGGFRNRHYWKIGAARSGLFQYTQEARLNWDWLKRVPADASGLTTGVFDATSFIASIGCLGAWATGNNPSMIAGIPTAVMPVQLLLKPVGHRYLVYRMPGHYGTFPMNGMLPNHNLIMVVETPDPDAMRTTIDGLLAMTGGSLQSTPCKVAGRDVISINLYYLTVYVALLEHEMLIAAHPQLLKDALENWQQPGPSIVDTPAFQEARRHLLENACFLMYVPPGGFARGIYDEYIPQLQQAIELAGGVSRMFSGKHGTPPAETLGFSSLTLPRGRDLTGGVKRATILSASDDGAGVLFDGYAPLLSTPYYWAYLHAITRLSGSRGLRGAIELSEWLVMPLAADDEAPASSPAGTRPMR